MRPVAQTVLGALLLAVPALILAWLWLHPFFSVVFGQHDRLWWIEATPRCWGPVCLDVWPGRIEIALRIPWP